MPFDWAEYLTLARRLATENNLAVLRIDKACPGTGAIDRFLADIVSKKGRLKVGVAHLTLQKVLSMLLMLLTLRVKALPKVVAIIESVLRSPFGAIHQNEIVEYLENIFAAFQKTRSGTNILSLISYFLVRMTYRSS